MDATASRHPISPEVYGIASYGLDATFAKEIQVPNIRWGGDGTTRYNWLVDSSNAGFDWYFMGGNGETTPVPSASADLMVKTYQPAECADDYPDYSLRQQIVGVELQLSRLRLWGATVNQSLRAPEWR